MSIAMRGLSRQHFFQCATVAIFIASGFQPCFGQDCAIDGEPQHTGQFEDVVSLLQRPIADSTHPVASSISATAPAGRSPTSVPQHPSQRDTLQENLFSGQPAFDSPQGIEPLTPGQVISHVKGFLLGVDNRLYTTDGGVLRVVALVLVVVALLVAVFAAFGCCSSARPADTLGLKEKVPSIHCPDTKWFFWQYVNRLMLLLVAAFSLMTWLSFMHILMPSDAKTFSIGWLLLFSAGLILVMFAYAWWYSSLTNKIAGYAETMGGAKAGEETRALMDKSYGNITDVNGYVLVQVWLQVYPIPSNAWPGWSFVVFFAAVFIAVILEMVQTYYGLVDTSKQILGMVSSNLLSASTWVIVGFWVLDIRLLANVPASQPPPIWLGFLCLFVSVIIMVASHALIVYTTGVDSADDQLSAKDKASFKESEVFFFGQKAIKLLNGALLYTTGLIFFHMISLEPEYASEIGWCSIAFFFGAGALLVSIEFIMLWCICLDGRPAMKESMLNMITSLAGWLTGKFLAGWFSVLLAGLSRFTWIPVAIVCQGLAIALEEVRALYLVNLAGDALTEKKKEVVPGDDADSPTGAQVLGNQAVQATGD